MRASDQPHQLLCSCHASAIGRCVPPEVRLLFGEREGMVQARGAPVQAKKAGDHASVLRFTRLYAPLGLQVCPPAQLPNAWISHICILLRCRAVQR